MGKKILVVVDMQNDFVTGSLGTAEAQAIVPAVTEKVRGFDGRIIFTRDTHETDYMSTQEGSMLPVEHCIRGTRGWELVEELDELRREKRWECYDKKTFGCVGLAARLRAENLAGSAENAGEESENMIESVELVGLCTDICVVSNALLLKAYMPEVPVMVDSSCCAGVTPATHQAALDTMKCCQIIIK